MDTRKSEVADAALWMHLNRGAGERLKSWSGAVIVTAFESCNTLDESKRINRAYTLEDMRTAYRMGFLAATDRTEAAAAYFNTNEFSDDREAALGRL